MSGDKDNETQVETILLVDDDSLVRESISLFLDAKGYSVLEAENGQEALAVLKTAPRVVSGNDKSDLPLEGVAAYIKKPINPDRLIEIIDRHRFRVVRTD